ncbi:alpha/beta fold hydrolase [Amycolatopsis sp. cg9]|uniref:alpha/beta fold hydrolase n=1 Tax=Amycolatopsis sp. cg9 TaxID=3238801 RepID=UPI0035247D67
MRRSAVMAASCAALIAAGGWLYQRVGQGRDERRFPPPGRLVDIGGRRLHVVRTSAGECGPVVVVLPALGATALEWHQVFRALPEDITAYAVDRGGVGWSDPAPRGPRTPTVLAGEITALLDALELTSVVLVGHSYGGIVARILAAGNPDRVVGLILVDSSHEDQARPLAAADPAKSVNELWWKAGRRQARPLGWTRAWHDINGRRRLIREAVGEVGARMAPAAAARALTTAHRRAVVGEFLGLAVAPRVTPASARRLGDLPMTVLTVGNGNGWGPVYPVWLELQRSLAAMSNRSRHLVLDGTGHHMNHDVPDQVAAAIADLITEVCVVRSEPPPTL